MHVYQILNTRFFYSNTGSNLNCVLCLYSILKELLDHESINQKKSCKCAKITDILECLTGSSMIHYRFQVTG